PHKMAYRLSILPTDGINLETRVQFFIRAKEGCDGDLNIGTSDRPIEYFLSKESLASAFKKYDIRITSYLDARSPTVEVLLDDQLKQIAPKDLSMTIDSGKQLVNLQIDDQ